MAGEENSPAFFLDGLPVTAQAAGAASKLSMPLPWKHEDRPEAVCFHLAEKDGGLEVTVTKISQEREKRYTIEGGAPRFAGRDDFKAKAVHAGFSPAVAEDMGRSFNATARQLRDLGFSIAVEEDETQQNKPEQDKAA